MVVLAVEFISQQREREREGERERGVITKHKNANNNISQKHRLLYKLCAVIDLQHKQNNKYIIIIGHERQNTIISGGTNVYL